MATIGSPKLASLLALSAVATVLVIHAASADVGVDRASRGSGPPGAEVRLVVGCGSCFPPCKGPRGHRHPEGFRRGPCIPGGQQPPTSFGISLLPQKRAEALLGCPASIRGCPEPDSPPRHGHYRYLGRAVPPPGGNDPEGGRTPHYVLRFKIPRLRAGEYSYALWCDACLDGPAGSVGVDPHSPVWRLRVMSAPPARRRAAIGQRLRSVQG